MENQIRTVSVIQPTKGLNSDRKIRIAAYCRVSTDSDDQENSFLAQIHYYTNFVASSPDMELADIYADEGITGTSISKRDEFKRMLHDAKLGRIDRVICKSVQRFARNSLECIESVRALKEYGVNVVFENDNIDTNGMNTEMILYIKSAFAQNESLSASTRMSTAYRMKMERGEYTVYHVPYGYRLENKKWVIDEEQAEVVKRIFTMYLSGYGIEKIAAELNKENVDSIHGWWSSRRISYMLKNEKYIGDTLAQKVYTPAVLPLKKKRNHGEMDQYYISNTHDAIISKIDFENVQKRMRSHANPHKQERNKHLLSQTIVCAQCGWRFKRKVINNKVYWLCGRSSKDGFSCNTKRYLEQDIYIAFVHAYNKLRCFEKELIDTTLNQLYELHAKMTKGNTEIQQIDNEITHLCEQNSRYEKYRAKKIMDEVSFMEQTGRLRNRLAELRTRRLKLIQDDENESTIENLRDLRKMLDELPMALLAFDNEIFEAVVDKIKVDDDVMTFVLKGGIELRERVGIE